MAQMPDFRAQYQIPMAAVIDSYRQKAVDEQNMRIQNEQMAMQRRAEPINQLTRLASLVHLGQSIASDMVANSTQKQMANARVTYSELLGKGNELVPSETMGQAKLFTNTPTGREYTSVPTNETVPYSTTPEYSRAAEQAFQTAYPDAYAARKSKLYDPEPIGTEEATKTAINYLEPGKKKPTPSYQKGTKIYEVGTDRELSGGFITTPVVASERLAQNSLGTAGTFNAATDEFTPFPPSGKNTGIVGLQERAPVVAVNVQKSLDDFSLDNQKVATLAGKNAGARQSLKIFSNPSKYKENSITAAMNGMVKASDDAGQITDADRAAFSEAASVIEKFRSKGYKAIKGELSPEVQKQLLNLASIAEERTRLQLKNVRETAINSAKAKAGSYWDDSIADQVPTVDQVVVSFSPVPSNNPADTSNKQDELLKALAKIGEDLKRMEEKRRAAMGGN
jgi:hypothetical protein